MFKVNLPNLLIFGLLSGLSTLSSAAEQCTSIGSSYYYSVTHVDMRKCAAPMCGGYFVKQVNQNKTLCADGVWRNECHVFQLDTKPLAWSESQTSDYFNQVFGQQKGIVRGNFAHALDANFSSAVDTLTITEAWQNQSKKPSNALLYKIKDTGIVCVKAPCLSTVKQTLNAWDIKDSLVENVSLDDAGASAEAVKSGYQQLSLNGILVAGQHRVAPPYSNRLRVNQFYLPVINNATVVGQSCGGVVGTVCSSDQFCELAANTSPSAGGTCQLKPQVCTLDYNPVCGYDGVTYANDCARKAAGAQLQSVGECQK
jgi:hypothetical protein